jgi:hypothetical protein
VSEPVINLGRLADANHRYDLTVSNESPEDAQARRLNEAAEATLARRMRLMLFCFALAFVSVVFAGCVHLFATGTAEDKKWAGGIVASITSGLIGYLVGGARK